MPELVMMAVGPDRPGLVSEFSRTFHAAGANMADSRMMNLHGQFAMLILVQADQATLEKLQTQVLETGSQTGLTVTLHPVAGQGRVSSGGQAGGLAYRLKTYSTDQPGIVHQITRLLQEHQVNIEELETRQESAAFAGTMLFTMQAKLTIPASVAIKPLSQKLQQAAQSIHCDLDFEPQG